MWLGLYPGNMLVNLNPPNFSLLLLGWLEAAALQLFRPVLPGRGAGPGAAVLGLAGRRAMTVYLWHLPLLAAMSGLLLLTDFPKPAGGTAAWWWGRPLVLLGIIACCSRCWRSSAGWKNARRRPLRPARPAAAVVTAAVVVFVPVADAALNGLTLALLGGGAACFALAVLLLGRIPALLCPPGPADQTRHCHTRH